MSKQLDLQTPPPRKTSDSSLAAASPQKNYPGAGKTASEELRDMQEAFKSGDLVLSGRDDGRSNVLIKTIRGLRALSPHSAIAALLAENIGLVPIGSDHILLRSEDAESLPDLWEIYSRLRQERLRFEKEQDEKSADTIIEQSGSDASDNAGTERDEEEDKDAIIPSQPRTRVYCNPHNQTVILQENTQPYGPADDNQFVFFSGEHLPALIVRLFEDIDDIDRAPLLKKLSRIT